MRTSKPLDGCESFGQNQNPITQKKTAMATSTCPKCSSTSFESKTLSPSGSNFKVVTVQCSSCGAVVGVTDYYNTALLLEKIAKKLGIARFF